MLPEESTMPDHRSPEQRVLAAALSAVHAVTGLSRRAIAAAAGISPGTLSTHLNGARVPTEPLMESFYAAAQAAADSAGSQLPFTLGQLRDYRHRATTRHCACCTAASSGRGTSSSGSGAGGRETPAFGAAHRLRHERRARRKRFLAASRSVEAAPAAQVPVPPPGGDRHPAAEADGNPVWTELETVTRYLSQNRQRDAGILLWQAGATMSASQILDVVSSCRNTGLNEAADAVLTSVSERSDRQAVLNVTAAFQQAGRHDDVSYLLAVSVQ